MPLALKGCYFATYSISEIMVGLGIEFLSSYHAVTTQSRKAARSRTLSIR